jgi:hypothetical protein
VPGCVVTVLRRGAVISEPELARWVRLAWLERRHHQCVARHVEHEFETTHMASVDRVCLGVGWTRIVRDGGLARGALPRHRADSWLGQSS